MVLYFKYLGGVLLAADDDWPSVIWNLTKTKVVWRRMARILIREGARPQVSVFFFKAVIQLVLIFGVEMWVVTPSMGRVLGGFQDQVARRLTGQLLRRRIDRKWEYTSAEAARLEAGFEPMETYIRQRQDTVAQYIAT